MDFVRVLKMVYLQRNNISEEISILIRFLKQCERKNGRHLSYQLEIWTNSKNSKPPILTILNLKEARISIMAWIYFHPSARHSHSGARPLRFRVATRAGGVGFKASSDTIPTFLG